ncbi:hypothetical protein ACLIA0_07665 [Bacillaceae bacterium W0354]
MKRDEIERQIGELPKRQMSASKKQHNWLQIKNKMNDSKRPNKWIVYPLTAIVIAMFSLIGYTFLLEKNKQTQLDEWDEVVTMFDDVKPFVNITHVNGPIKIEYSKSILIGYLYQSAIFIDDNGEEINPLEIKDPIENYFDETKRNEAFLSDVKTIWVYLNSAKNQLHCSEGESDCINLLDKIDEWLRDLNQITVNHEFEHNYSLYEKVSIELATLAQAIDRVTVETYVFEGSSSQWEVGIQPINQNNYLITLLYQGLLDSSFDGVGELELELTDDAGNILAKQTMNVLGVGGSYSDFLIKDDIEALDGLILTVKWFEGQEDTIHLKKKLY